MAERRRRAVRRRTRLDKIINYLNESDFDDSDDDLTYQPEEESALRDQCFSSNDSSSESLDTSDELLEEESSRDAVGRRGVRHGINRGRNLGVRRGIQRVSSNGTQPIAGGTWLEKGFSPIGYQQLMEPSYLPKQAWDESCKLQYFEQYIGEEIYVLITEKSNQTSVAKTGRSLGLTVRECKVFFGISVLMSCINYPITRMYWEAKWRVPAIADAMTRDRYFLIRNSLKLVYDDDITSDQKNKNKLWKVQPILDSITKGCLQQTPSQKIAVDEMIIPFTGNCGLKQYCPNKPNPSGLKVFVLANVDGLVCNMIVYQGKPTFPALTDNGFGLGESAVLKLTEILVPGTIVYNDRYFTSIKLLEELLKRGIKCTGTIMLNRIPRHIRDLLKSDLSMKHRGRGSYQTLTREDDSMAITKWYDNKAVIMLSTAEAANTIDQCRRWCKKDKIYIMVDRQEVIKNYYANMGGVDLADRLLAVCPTRTRTRKWTVRFIAHMFDLAISNAWVEYKENEIAKGLHPKKIQQLRYFKMELGQKLIEENILPVIIDSSNNVQSIAVPNKRPGRPGVVAVPSKIKRTFGAYHLPEVITKQQRCRQPGCNKRSTIVCSHCNVALCLTSLRNCFKLFHTDE